MAAACTLHTREEGVNKHGAKWIWPKTREAIYARDDYRCAYCLLYVGPSRKAAVLPSLRLRVFLTLDHIVPRELGGTNEPTNLVTACVSCNSMRQSTGIRAWFVVLRGWGVDTAKIGRRIRRLVRTPL